MCVVSEESFENEWSSSQLVPSPIDDFSGPAESTTFPLGSLIPIMATVEQLNHQPLLLLLDECVAAATPELWSEDDTYAIITNKGYACLYL